MTNHRHDLRAIARQAMLDRGLEPSFTPAALEKLKTIGGPDAAAGLDDLTDRLWCSIDNDDSRDLDQLTVAEAQPGGAARILVAVADVDTLVKAGDPIDAHAVHNTTSVYTVPEVFPMLPERLSTDLTSLNESQDRAAIVIAMTVDAHGACGSTDVRRARVRNRAKLTYRGVAAWLDGSGPMPEALAAVPGLADNLRLQDRTAQALREVRHERGALSLESTEARAVFDGERLADLLPDRKNRAHELIEDLMIAANEVMAQALDGRGFPSLRRILREPERWDRIVEVARQQGGHLPDAPDARALNEFLMERRRADPKTFPDLSLVIIKLLGSGEYVVKRGAGSRDAGHFGLAVPHYAHSTAPNRRFPDLIAQRLMKAAIAGGRPPYGPGDLDELARRCTLKEDDAKKVERRVVKSAAALLLEPRVGERFDAVVTGASDKGVWVRLLKPAAEGKLVRGDEDLDVGDSVRVELLSTDVERGFVDFARVRR